MWSPCIGDSVGQVPLVSIPSACHSLSSPSSPGFPILQGKGLGGELQFSPFLCIISGCESLYPTPIWSWRKPLWWCLDKIYEMTSLGVISLICFWPVVLSSILVFCVIQSLVPDHLGCAGQWFPLVQWASSEISYCLATFTSTAPPLSQHILKAG